MNFDDFLARVGQNVRRARWEAGLTIEALAAQTMTTRLLGELERGRGNPTLETLFTLARVLDVSPDSLLSTSPAGRAKSGPPKRGRPKKAAAR